MAFAFYVILLPLVDSLLYSKTLPIIWRTIGITLFFYKNNSSLGSSFTLPIICPSSFNLGLEIVIIIILFRILYELIVIVLFTNTFTFFQVTGSALRPLTNIPHCCTNTHWGFFRPNVVDRPLTDLLVSFLYIRDLFPYFKVAKLSFTHLYTTTTQF
ncbi:hypothetical protein VTN02DRAFT_406 [Thermoascus thermophilus]